MNATAERLNNQIDLMLVEKSPFAPGAGSVDASEIAMIQIAAGLKSLRNGPAGPDPGFAAQLRALMLAAASGTKLADN